MEESNIYKDHILLLNSIESKIKILDKYKKHFTKEELNFINKSKESRKIFENKSFYSEVSINSELLKQDLIATNNSLNYFIEYLKENNLYISESKQKLTTKIHYERIHRGIENIKQMLKKENYIN